MKRTIQTIVALTMLVLAVSAAFGYTKPNTYRAAVPSAIVFKEQVPFSPHSWVIPKAIALLRADGLGTEADLAQKYLLPMLEGVTFNDVWGDADLAGASMLDYYVPDSPAADFGFGCTRIPPIFELYKNCTSDFKKHALYGYGNAAEHAQFRYDYGKRIYLGHWGDDPRDKMAGWVIDTLGGQDDPMNSRWASGTAGIDAATAPDGTRSRFGTNHTPAEALQDLLQNHTNTQVVFPDQSDDMLSTIHVPTDEVFGHAPEWFDDLYNNADDVEAYMGWDGHDYAWYASWTLDAGGQCHDGSDCAAPMVVRLPVGSKAHAFFQLGWAIHLLEDNTTPVHTVDGSFLTFEVHNDVESLADYAIGTASVDAGFVKDLLPSLGVSDFMQVYDWPPTPGDSSCVARAGDPADTFHARWYTDTLSVQAGEGVAHAYTRNVAESSHRFMSYIDCIDTEDDHNWGAMGFFTAAGLDNAIKATAGLIRQFIEDVDKTPPAVTIVQPAPTTYPHSSTLTLDYSGATDDESGVKSVTATLDGKTLLYGHGLASGQAINLLDELSVGDHTFTVTAIDNAGNVASPSVTFSIVVTAASIIEDVHHFLSTGDITVNNEANSLLQKLEAGAAYRAAGDCKDAGEVYQAFINEVAAQSGKKVSEESAAIMTADARYLIANCP